MTSETRNLSVNAYFARDYGNNLSDDFGTIPTPSAEDERAARLQCALHGGDDAAESHRAAGAPDCERTCRHAPNAHEQGPCRLCGCTGWLSSKRHVWREQVTDAWLLATETWLRHREAVCVGWTTEEKEFEEHHPRPKLADFMDAMRPGIAPEVLEELTIPCRCCERREAARAS